MRNSFTMIFSLLAGLTLTSAVTVHAHEMKWTCTKDGKTIPASGKSTKEMRAACEKSGGSWTQQHQEEKHEAKPAEAQSSGGGGVW